MTIQPDSGPASSPACTLSLSAVPGRSIADAPSAAHWNWISGSDADARRSEVVDRVHRLSQRLLGPGAGNTNSIPVNADPGIFPPEIMRFTALAGDHCPDLRDALYDLDEARDEAREEGFPAPSDVALGNARRLLHAMYRLSPRRFEIYPMPDGGIAIDAPGGSGRSVLLLCGSDGGALCSVNMDGVRRRARYSETRGLPDGFVRDALAELERPDSVAA